MRKEMWSYFSPLLKTSPTPKPSLSLRRKKKVSTWWMMYCMLFLHDDKWKIFLRDVRMFLFLYVLVKGRWDEKYLLITWLLTHIGFGLELQSVPPRKSQCNCISSPSLSPALFLIVFSHLYLALPHPHILFRCNFHT